MALNETQKADILFHILMQILRATGKCFHPDCFKCEVCHKKLDGVQFTVDNFNKVHCIEDYYRYNIFLLHLNYF